MKWMARIASREPRLSMRKGVRVVGGLLALSAASLGATASAQLDTPSPTPTATAVESSPQDDGQGFEQSGGITYNEHAGGAGGKNVVIIQNPADGSFRIRAHIQFNRIPAPIIEPANIAYAYSHCTDCESLAVALQINLIGRNSSIVTPQNAAVAANVGCTRCRSVARAIQHVQSVDNPTDVPPEVNQLIADMRHELTAVQTEQGITLAEAEARIEAVILRFRELAMELDDQRDEAVELPGTLGP